MTGKLLKYDLKSMLRNFVPLWIALLAVSFINYFTVHTPSFQAEHYKLPAMVALLVYGSLVVAVMVVTAVLVIQRFYQGLLKDEGYLMFTLPVKPWQLLTSKLVSAVIVCLGSAIVGILSVLVITYNAEAYQSLFDGLVISVQIHGESFLSAGLMAFAFGLCAVTQIYVSLALGHLAHKYRLGWAVGIYIAIHMVFSWIELAVMFGARLPMTLPLFQIHSAEQFFLLAAAYYFLRAVLFFVVTERILSKKLNLE